MAQIDGEIPSIDPKNVEMGDFALDKRKTSAYLPRNELPFGFNRKNSAYFTLLGYLIKDSASI
jgi:hypothetical protein